MVTKVPINSDLINVKKKSFVMSDLLFYVLCSVKVLR